MRRTAPLLFLLLVLGLAGCGHDGPLDPGERRALSSARDTWNAHKPAEYTYEYRARCFCPIEITIWSEVHVRHDSVVSVTPLQALPPGAVIAPPFTRWPTVNGLFDIIDGSANAESTVDVQATYDPEFGYPTSISIRCPDDYLDCGAVYSARNLRASPQ